MSIGFRFGLQKKRRRLDPDAANFFTVTGITDPTQKEAVNYLATELKSESLWSKMDVISPFVGGNASAHSYNLKDTSQNQITWSGTVTHNANGITGNGVDGYGDTGYIIDPANQNDLHMSIYHRNNITTGVTIGTLGAANVSFIIIPYNGIEYESRSNSFAGGNTANANSTGFFLSSRNGLTDAKSYKNGSVILTDAQGTNTPSLFPTYILARNNNGTADFFTSSNLAFASIGEKLNDAEALLFYNIVQQYQTLLSRNV